MISSLDEVSVSKNIDVYFSDVVVNSLKKIDSDPYKALFKLAFSSYLGWKK